ncbi:hypothetical protein Vafri_4603 [Volvox africanus]|uniref:Ap4A phosphorylase II n=1 Tax=Volvox africanus TaxID=51714 RepID=A0A8J4EWE9_9CHLO|nr:hypothetical protein Vafri_4603 [Volvox africanus]
MIPARALRCQRKYNLQIQAAATSTWVTTTNERHIERIDGRRSCSILTGATNSSSSSSRSSKGCDYSSVLRRGGAGGSSVQGYRQGGGAVRPSNITMASSAAYADVTGVSATSVDATATVTATAATTTAAAASLWDNIVSVYNKAQVIGACSKTDTQVEVLRDLSLGIDFVLRVATALKAKPQGPPASQPAPGPTAASSAPPWRNPFLPPEPELFVRELDAEHSLVLNKFNVVQHHVLVITREFRSQAEPLNGGDLAATLEVLRAMPSGGVAFYNCGPNSGRSQPHKHLQVVPLPFTDAQLPLAPVHHLVEEAAAAAAATAPLQPLHLRQLPYRCYAALLPPERPTPEQLESAFSDLLQLCYPGYVFEPSPLLREGPPRDAATAAAVAAGSVSYNVLLTRSWMMLVPRSAERCGPLALNSLAFAGTMLVRSDDELDYVRQTGPVEILRRIGEPW